MLIVTDLDGTIVNHGLVSERTISAFEKARKNGAKIVLATARTLEHTLLILEQMESVVDYLVSSNGATIHNVVTGETKNQRFTKNVVGEIVMKLRNLNQNVLIGLDGMFETKAKGNKYLNSYKTLEFGDTIKECSVITVWEKNLQPLTGQSEKIEKTLTGLGEVTWVNHFCFQIRPAGINKAVTLEKLREQLDISSDSTVAFGDSYNDIEMLQWANTGVAVENAVPELKKVADFVTSSNAENGVAVFIEQLTTENHV